jgi:hypothetical protein
MTEFLCTVKKALCEMHRDRSADTESLRYHLMHIRDVLERWKIVGLNRKLQIKPRKIEDKVDEETGESVTRCTEVQLILKWVSLLLIDIRMSISSVLTRVLLLGCFEYVY